MRCDSHVALSSDPADGTTNFVHGFPFACISIGLIDQKRPVLGVIYNPFLDHLYTGTKGQGSFLTRNGGQQQKLPLTPARPLPSLSQALVGACLISYLLTAPLSRTRGGHSASRRAPSRNREMLTAEVYSDRMGLGPQGPCDPEESRLVHAPRGRSCRRCPRRAHGTLSPLYW